MAHPYKNKILEKIMHLIADLQKGESILVSQQEAAAIKNDYKKNI